MSAVADAKALPLPDHVYVPGLTSRHPEGFLDHVIVQSPEATNTDGASENLPWHYGIRLFHEGYYWEAHEVWEAVWIKAPPASRERFLVQAAIHVTNARLKLRMNRQAAHNRLIDLAVECLNRAFQGAGTGKSATVVMGYEKTVFLKEYEL